MSRYEKHNLFVGKYQLPESGFVPLPKARWRIARHTGTDAYGGLFSYDPKDDGEAILLALEDGMFWPVMSFLSRDEAAALAGELARFAGGILTSNAEVKP